jgi:hypothetical protein
MLSRSRNIYPRPSPRTARMTRGWRKKSPGRSLPLAVASGRGGPRQLPC